MFIIGKLKAGFGVRDRASGKKKGIAGRTAEASLFATSPLAGAEELYDALRSLRKRLADQDGLPPYIVFSDKVLHLLVQQRPTTLEAFGQINGIGEFKKKKYGRDFVDLIRQMTS